jgi:thiol-disulfide isomerase/thioredoxin
VRHARAPRGLSLPDRPTRLLAVVLVVAVAASAAGPEPVDGQTPPSEVGVTSDTPLVTYGDADYSWKIRLLEGATTTLEPYRGEVLFINLWASWCTPCVRELASIERLWERLGDTDVRFLIVAAEGERPVRRFLRRYGYDLPFYLEISRMPTGFGLRGLPTSWVVDRDGRIVLLRHGEAVWDTDEVEAFLRRVAEAPTP